jgi:Lon protease-like protein
VPRLRDVPLFPLGIVLLPGEVLPLHIFEPRYREMVARCLAGPEPFCVVLEDDAGMREVGCLARDLTVLERLADGRLNIVVSGGEPVRLGPIDEGAHSYLSAEALVLEDDVEPLAEDEMEAALTAYRALLSEIGREDPEPLSTQPRLAYALGARIDVGLQVGQALLESRSEAARLVLITEALEQGRHSLRIAAERERRAVRNGKVEPTGSDVP